MRYTVSSLAVGALIVLAPSAALAQSSPSDPSIESYLCAFAGKCGEPAAPAEVTMDAPATKGFRVARADIAAKSAPVTVTRDAPAAKGFRVAKVEPAPRREFRPRPAPINAAPANVVRPAAPVSAGAGRANLMIGFELGSDRMTASGRQKAAIFARSLNMAELRGMRFAIEGHTDTRGNADANRDLSLRRAQTVAQFLSDNGVDKARLQVKGLGADAPLSGYDASNPANRRVEAELLR